MLCGSCVGVATWTLYMQLIVYNMEAQVLISGFFSRAIDERAQTLLLLALFAQRRAWFSVMYAIEFFCLSVAKLMVLERMSYFVALRSSDASKRRWFVGRRAVMAAVITGNLVGFAGNVAAAVQWQSSYESWTAASAEWSANKTDSALSLGVEGLNTKNKAMFTLSVQSLCEVIVLLIIVVAFSVVGVACARRITSTLHALNAAGAAAAQASQLRLHIVGTTAVVFATFLVRTAYSMFYALAVLLQNVSSCPNNPNLCDSCFNTWARIEVWILRTPALVLPVVLVTKPLPLLVALWGMTSDRTRREMQRTGLGSAALREKLSIMN
jgi:hypothetical protein